jgi:hypothetical protein
VLAKIIALRRELSVCLLLPRSDLLVRQRARGAGRPRLEATALPASVTEMGLPFSSRTTVTQPADSTDSRKLSMTSM